MILPSTGETAMSFEFRKTIASILHSKLCTKSHIKGEGCCNYYRDGFSFQSLTDTNREWLQKADNFIANCKVDKLSENMMVRIAQGNYFVGI